ncbi:unnamed protein product [Phytophthora fragariaefolia]|uniref:Transmembrane protein 267 n=1 Tax=Phytophthora fragariaefolia TaxID=1490495 RepID=A0A9W6U8W8_9STRA|nr:unnamed protein product [Phytophthora fragariaefolia]
MGSGQLGPCQLSLETNPDTCRCDRDDDTRLTSKLPKYYAVLQATPVATNIFSMVTFHAIAMFAAVAAVAMTDTDNANASFVRKLDNENDNSFDEDSFSSSGSSSFEGYLTGEPKDPVPKFGQCGGIGYEGNVECAQGCICVQASLWFAQCLPRGASTSASTKKRAHHSKLHVDDTELLLEDMASDEADVVPAWEQCGGKGFDFDFSRDDSLPDDETPMQPCEEDYTCNIVNEWYYQCQPLAKLTGIKLWEQCGGADYRGSTQCTIGSVCKYFNAWYSQCVPKEQAFSSTSRRYTCDTVRRAKVYQLIYFLLFIILFSEYLLDYKLLRHLVDSAAHGTVALCCWAIFLLQIEKHSESSDSTFSIVEILKKCFLNGAAASLLDVDHFVAAGALSLAGATHLNGRPFGHAVTFIVVVALLVNRSSKSAQARKRRYRVCFIVVAWFSHQLRDGMRHGLWFWPLGSTPPLNYFLYVAMEEGLPFAMAKWWSKAPALSDMEKLELALQKFDEESEEESGGEANSSDEEGSRLLIETDAKECPPSPTKVAIPRRMLSQIV